jgi:hypothetical protein
MSFYYGANGLFFLLLSTEHNGERKTSNIKNYAQGHVAGFPGETTHFSSGHVGFLNLSICLYNLELISRCPDTPCPRPTRLAGEFVIKKSNKLHVKINIFGNFSRPAYMFSENKIASKKE